MNSMGLASTNDVVALGSAIVDVFCTVPEGLLSQLGLIKGSMQLVGPDLADSVVSRLGRVEMKGGGSAANTLVGLASLGHRSTLIARTDSDHFGRQYVEELESIGVHVERPDVSHDLGTGRCLVLVTPDGERTMATWLGAASHLELDHKGIEAIKSSKILYIEGYLYDIEDTKRQIHQAIEAADQAGALVALSLSDPFCVDRHRDEFLDLLEGKVSLVFANQDEAQILTQKSDLDDMVEFFRFRMVSGAITRGKLGAMVFNLAKAHLVPAVRVEKVVDTTGAGDLFAAGFLHGVLSLGLENIVRCGEYATICSAEVITHFGARPEQDLNKLLRE